MAIGIIDHQSPSATHKIYNVVFFGEYIHTTVARDPAVVSHWISTVESTYRHRLHQLIVGLDIEWRPNFTRGVTNPAATLQICVGRRCLIFQLLYSPSIPGSLVIFLRNPSYTFVGVGIKEDLEKLQQDYGFGFDTRTVDLRDLAAARYGRRELRNSGVKKLAKLVLRRDVNKRKKVTMSRWDSEWLSPSQVMYACLDAFVCFEIGWILNAPAATLAPR